MMFMQPINCGTSVLVSARLHVKNTRLRCGGEVVCVETNGLVSYKEDGHIALLVKVVAHCNGVSQVVRDGLFAFSHRDAEMLLQNCAIHPIEIRDAAPQVAEAYFAIPGCHHERYACRVVCTVAVKWRHRLVGWRPPQ